MRILKDLVEEGLPILSGGQDLAAFGELLHEAWLVKRSLSERCPTPAWTTSMHEALEAGADRRQTAGRRRRRVHAAVRSAGAARAGAAEAHRLIHVPFKFESQGSQVVLFDQEVDYSHEDLARQGLPTEQFQELCNEADCFAA